MATFFLADGANPIQIAAIPDVGKANQQHGEKHRDITKRQQGQLLGPLFNTLSADTLGRFQLVGLAHGKC